MRNGGCCQARTPRTEARVGTKVGSAVAQGKDRERGYRRLASSASSAAHKLAHLWQAENLTCLCKMGNRTMFSNLFKKQQKTCVS